MTKHYEIIECPQRIREILLSDSFPPTSIAANYEKLSNRFNLDFKAIIFFIKGLPVFLHGQEHLSLRKKMVNYLAQTKKEDLMIARQISSSLVDISIQNKKIIFKKDCLIPLWRGILVNRNFFTADEINLVERLPALFNIYLPLRERIEINQKLDTFIKNRSNIDEYMMKLSLHALGFSPFQNSILLSLNDCIGANVNTRMSDINFDAIPSHSSFKYTDRIDKDYYYRCALQSEKYSADEKKKLMFGYGVHACIGKNLTLMVWQSIIEALRKIPFKIRKVELVMQNIPYYKFNSVTDVADPFVNCDDLTIDFH